MLRIDSHHHLWDPSWRKYEWMQNAELTKIAKPFLLPEYESVALPKGISNSILVQVLPTYEETPDFLEIAAGSKTIAGVIGWIDLTQADSWRKISHYRELEGGTKLVGIRELIQDHPGPGWMLQNQVITNVRKLGEIGLVFDLLTLDHQLVDAVELVRSCPEVTFVLDHLSKPKIATRDIASWQRNIAKLALAENVNCKISGMVTEADWQNWQRSDFEPYFKIALEAFGPKRLLFGSDWPVCNLAGDYSEVYELADFLTQDLSETENALFWGGNAVRIYKLDINM